MDVKDFAIGLHVIPDPNHIDFDAYFCQYQKEKGSNEVCTGTIAKEMHNGSNREKWTYVRWENGHENSYPLSLLKLVDEKKLQKVKEELERVNQLYPIPFLPGTRVCLNPESKAYKDWNQRVKGNAGYVIETNFDDKTLLNWAQDISKADRQVLVCFDNEVKIFIKHRDLLQVDAPSITITKYMLSCGDSLSYKDNDNTEYMDKLIFKHGYKLKDKIVMDNDWRAEIISKIAKSAVIDSIEIDTSEEEF